MLQRKDIARLVGCSYQLVKQWQDQGFLPQPDSVEKPFLWKRETMQVFFKTKNMVNAYAYLQRNSGRDRQHPERTG